jgi:membrane-bound lytic murein transglycosylase D
MGLLRFLALLLFSTQVFADRLYDQEDSFYHWVANTQVMHSDSLLVSKPVFIQKAFINRQRIANATPLIKFYADTLIKEGVPIDFAILPFIESDNNPLARSPKNALGLWQFIPSTGSEWGLQKSISLDERTDVQKSTVAAAKYLRFLYEKFHDWNLVLAAYNCGGANVMAALRKGLKLPNGQINLSLLPLETQSYLVSFYAFNRVVRDEWHFNELKKYPNQPYLIKINHSSLAYYLNEHPEIKPINDWVLKYVNGFDVKTNGTSDKIILVPTSLFARYFLLTKVSFKNPGIGASIGSCGGGQHVQYAVKYGETLETIAKHFKMKVDQLLDLNPSVRFVRPGMAINIC